MIAHLTLAAAMAIAAGPAQPAPFKTEIGSSGKPIAVPDVRIASGRPTLVLARPLGDRSIQEEADAILHPPTGVRLPRVHQGCRLAAVLPLAGPNSYARGAAASYDCTPSETLTHVTVSFEAGSKLLRSGDPAKHLAGIGTRINQALGESICGTAGAGSQHPPHAGLVVSHCFAERRDGAGAEVHTYGATTSLYGRGKSFIRFSRKCVDDQCAASLPAFDAFLETFDLRGFSETASRR